MEVATSFPNVTEQSRHDRPLTNLAQVTIKEYVRCGKCGFSVEKGVFRMPHQRGCPGCKMNQLR